MTATHIFTDKTHSMLKQEIFSSLHVPAAKKIGHVWRISKEAVMQMVGL